MFKFADFRNHYYFENGVEQKYLVADKYYEISAGLSNSTTHHYLAHFTYKENEVKQVFLKKQKFCLALLSMKK